MAIISTFNNVPVKAWLKAQYPWLIVLAGLCCMYIPTGNDLFQNVWNASEQAHGPIVFAISMWLFYQKRHDLLAAKIEQNTSIFGWFVLIGGLFFYITGRSQNVYLLEVGSFICLLLGIGLILLGKQAVKIVWFPLFFMLFMIPLPSGIVETITVPMKKSVSFVAEQVLYALNYPISRDGVKLFIGQYQLLVADACAGLHTLFTLESLGLLYLNLVRHESLVRNVVLAILIVPISFTANVIRVMVLTLITYHFGDEWGQGFLHGFAGMVLFLSALLLIIGVDALIRIVLTRIQRIKRISC